MRATDPKRCIVVGDIHGELEGFRDILRNAVLVDEKDNWIGGDDILIQTGDVVDRGPHSLEAVDFLRKIQKEAAIVKGEVVRLCGNHELMLLQHYFHYANFKNPKSLADKLREEILRGDVRASYTDGTRLYTHAGLRSAIRKTLISEMEPAKPILKTHEVDLCSLSDHINRIFRESAENDDLRRHPIFHVDSERGGYDPVGGIFWCDFSSMSPSLEASEISQIFGHTPTRKNGVKTAQGLKLINLDAGMCQVYGGKRVYLEITAEGNLMQHSKGRTNWKITILGEE